MRNFLGSDLSRREAQIMEILYRRGRATAAEIQEEMPDAPGYSAVRKHLQILREKDRVDYEYDGPRHVYFPSAPVEEARRSAILQVIRTFFDGAPARAIETLLDAGELEREELERIARMAEEAREEGR